MKTAREILNTNCKNKRGHWIGITEDGVLKAMEEFQEPATKPEKYEPYFGWCDVKGCKNEGCSGGLAWRETGYWTVCYKHSASHRNGDPQPVMKAASVKREKTRDKTTGYLTHK